MHPIFWDLSVIAADAAASLSQNYHNANSHFVDGTLGAVITVRRGIGNISSFNTHLKMCNFMENTPWIDGVGYVYCHSEPHSPNDEVG